MLTPIGLILNGCRIIEEIGSGGMGTVYRAHDEKLDRDVAIKIMKTDGFRDSETRLSVKRFLREAEALARCDHPGIIKIHSFGYLNKNPYFVMELMSGRSLDSLIKTSRQFLQGELNAADLREAGYLNDQPNTPYFLQDHPTLLTNPDHLVHAIRLMAQISGALREAHSLGIIHRDLKPSNILLDAKGNPKLADLGLARGIGESEITRTGQLIGTIPYMAPELFSGKTDAATAASDVWGLGVILYQLITLRHPCGEIGIEQNTPMLIARISTGDFVSPRKWNADIPDDIQEVVLKALAADPKKRYFHAGDLATALKMTGAFTGKIERTKTFFSGFQPPKWLDWFRDQPQDTRNPELESNDIHNEPEEPSTLSSSMNSEPIDANRLHQLEANLSRAENLMFREIKFFEVLPTLREELPIKYLSDQTLRVLEVGCLNYSFFGNTQPIPSLLAPWSGNTRVRLLNLFLIEKDDRGAWALATSLSHEFPENPVIAFIQIASARRANRLRESSTLLNEWINLHPNDILFRLERAEMQISNGDIDEGFSEYDSLIQQYPDILDIRLSKTQQLREFGDTAKLSEEIEAILQKDSRNMFARGLLVSLYCDISAWTIADQEIRRLIALASESSVLSQHHLYYVRSLISQGRQDHDAAKRHRELARHLNNGKGYRDPAEDQQEYQHLDLSWMVSENFEKETLLEYSKLIRHLLFLKTCPTYWNSNLYTTALISIDSWGDIRSLESWIFTKDPSEEGAIQLPRIHRFLKSPPFSPFTTHQGDVLKVSFSKGDSIYGAYRARIELDEGQTRGSFEVITAEFEPCASLSTSNPILLQIKRPHSPRLQTIAFLFSISKSLGSLRIENLNIERLDESATHVFYRTIKTLKRHQPFEMDIPIQPPR